MILNFDQYITSNGQHPKFLKEFEEMPNHDDLLENTMILISKVSELCSHAHFEKPFVTSGWRPSWFNLQIGGAEKSKHIYAQAIDISDPDKVFGEWCAQNVEMLREIGLYMESLFRTHASLFPSKRWVHLQICAPKSGNVIFTP